MDSEELQGTLRKISESIDSLEKRFSMFESGQREWMEKAKATDAAYQKALSEYRLQGVADRAIAMVARVVGVLLVSYIAYKVS